MASHRWLFSVHCPGCGAAGAVRVLEDAGPPFTDPPRRGYQPVGEFEIFVDQDPVLVRCEGCKAAFVPEQG